MSIVTVAVRCSTGESWNGIMHDVQISAGEAASTLFFVSFLVLGQFMMLNLLVAIILENFEREMDEDLDDVTPSDVENFTDAWEAVQKDDANRMAKEAKRQALIAEGKDPEAQGPGGILGFVSRRIVPSAATGKGEGGVKTDSEGVRLIDGSQTPTTSLFGDDTTSKGVHSMYMRAERFRDLINALEPPLGLEQEFRGFRGQFLRLARTLDIPITKDGKITYTHTLRALVRRACGDNLPTDMDEALNANLNPALQKEYNVDNLSDLCIAHVYACELMQSKARSVIRKRSSTAADDETAVQIATLGSDDARVVPE